jgi:hypothetical protein
MPKTPPGILMLEAAPPPEAIWTRPSVLKAKKISIGSTLATVLPSLISPLYAVSFTQKRGSSRPMGAAVVSGT